MEHSQLLHENAQIEALAGWGRMGGGPCAVYRPERPWHLPPLLRDAPDGSLIPRGLGRSYGDAAVNDGAGVVDMTRLHAMHAFDPETGILECESGVSLAEIIHIFLPRGFFLPVTPGTKFVTVGGAIANDVHGKNHHHDGTFGQHVESLELLTPMGNTLHCSPTENSAVFWATVGGIGLTGIILRARIRLQPVASAYIQVEYYKARNLEAALDSVTTMEGKYQYVMAWVDCLARGGNLGRSVVMGGVHAPVDFLPADKRAKPFHIPPKHTKAIPIDCPQFMLNPLSIKAFNFLFNAKHRNESGVCVDYDSYYYPLDGIHNWNRMYGKAGFAQYQATIPKSEGAGLIKLLERLSVTGRASFLAVLKGMGAANPGLLSHPFEGYTLTLDIPNRTGLIPFLHELDRIVLDHGGKLYLAKDVAATAETIAAMYPQLGQFQEILGTLDPEQRFNSTMARRLGIVAS